MGQKYFIERERASTAMAKKAIGAEARLIHLELAGRYSIQAADAVADEALTASRALKPAAATQTWVNEGGS
jgi:hypothetical protein